MKIGKIFALICVFCFSLSLVTLTTAKGQEMPVSPALNIIAEDSYVALSCVADSTLSFDAEDFERALNLSYISSVTVTELPSRADGILYLGNSEVSEGQTVSRANIGYLNFEFLGENIDKSSFRFKTEQGAYDIECMMYSLKYANSAPTADIGGVTQVSTYKNVSFYGQLSAYDPEGDRIIYEIVKQPSDGLLKVDKNGEYVYTPTKGYVGNDSFKYVALDEYGNYSASREIKLDVESQRSSVVFSDITSGEYHVAAISLTEKGIMSAQEVDGKYYFYPDSELGRLEYLVMAMKSMNINISGNGESTVFSDDALIPANLKGYVNTAVKLGIISGKIDSEGNLVFAPNDKITRAEAAVVLNNMSELDAPILRPVFADSNALPVWAEEAIYRLTYNGIMPNENGYASASQTLNRDEGAYMLYMLELVSKTK